MPRGRAGGREVLLAGRDLREQGPAWTRAYPQARRTAGTPTRGSTGRTSTSTSIDAVVLSHAHLDHMGFLPALYKFGYDGPVYCTEPTLPLMTLLQNDFIKIAQMEGGRVLYDQKDITGPHTAHHHAPVRDGHRHLARHQARPQQRGAHPGLRDRPPPHRGGGPQHRLHGRLQVRQDAALRLRELELPARRDADHRGHLRQQGGHHAAARGGGDELRQRHQQHPRQRREGAHPDTRGGEGAGDNPRARPLHEEQGPHRGAGLPRRDDLRGDRDTRLLRGLPLEGAPEQDTRAGRQPVRQRVLHLHRAPLQQGRGAQGRSRR